MNCFGGKTNHRQLQLAIDNGAVHRRLQLDIDNGAVRATGGEVEGWRKKVVGAILVGHVKDIALNLQAMSSDDNPQPCHWLDRWNSGGVGCSIPRGG